MIVKVAGWVYIVQAALCLMSLSVSLPLPFAGTGQSGTLLLGGTLAAIGVGLLKTHPWGRWFALGVSFLGWTLGGLFLLGLLVLGVFALGGSLGQFGGFVFGMIMFMVLTGAVFLVINFKLFWYLVSDDGKAEFGAPETGSAGTVALSCVAWIAVVLVSTLLTAGGRLMTAPMAMMMSSNDDDADEKRAALEMQRELERRKAERESAQRRTALDAQRRREELEAARLVAETPDPPPEPEVIRESEVPDFRAYTQPEESEKPASNKILKCRDGAGNISYTQGYCPSGSKEVEAPKFE